MHDVESIERELQETVEAMSADARDAWEELEWLIEKARTSGDNPPYRDTTKIIERLYPSAGEELGKAVALKVQLLRTQVEEATGKVLLHRQVVDAMEKAIELEPDLDQKSLTAGEAFKVLERHGVKSGISPEVLEMEVPVPPEKWWEQIKMPADGVPTDENGIPLRSATPDGFGIDDAEGNVIYLDALQAEAMRLLGQHMTFENFVEGLPGDMVNENQKRWQEIKDSLTGGGLPAGKAEERADEAVNRMLSNSYLEFLAVVVKEEPEVRGMIDCFRGEKTAAAGRYSQRLMRSFVEPLVEEFIEEKVAEGEIVRSFDEEGNEVLKVNKEHPPYKRRQSELREKSKALSPERREIYEALQDEKRGEHRMNDHGAMHTVENLDDEEVSELRSRVRRIRRGLEVQKVPFRRPLGED